MVYRDRIAYIEIGVFLSQQPHHAAIVSRQDMNPFPVPRELFPQFPEDIHSLWFDGRVRSNGWPPVGPAWMGALRGRSIEYWQALVWQKEKVRLRSIPFSDDSAEIIQGLCRAAIFNESNIYSRTITDLKPRFFSFVLYLRQHRRFPVPPILLRDGAIHELVDGCHRIAAYFAVTAEPATAMLVDDEQEVWIGQRP